MGYQARCLQIERAGAIARTCETRFDGHGRNTNARPDHDRQPIGCKVRKISSTLGRLVLAPMLLARASDVTGSSKPLIGWISKWKVGPRSAAGRNF